MTVKTIDQYLDLCQNLQQQGKLEQAIATYHQAIGEFPQNSQLYNRLGKVLVEQGNLAEAIAIFRQGIEVQPGVSWLYYHLAETLKAQGNLAAAIVNYQQAIELEDDVYWFYFHLGQAFSKQENFTQAIVNYQQAIELGMKDPWVHYSLAQALEKQGDCQGAIAHYQRAIEINPNVSSFYESIYFLRRRLDQDKSEIIIFDKSNGLKDNQPDKLTINIQSLQSKAEEFTEKKDLELALQCYQEIINLDPSYGKVIYQIGKIQEQLNQINLAQEYYQRASILKQFTVDSKVILVFFSARHITPRCRYNFLGLVNNLPGKKLFVRDIQDAWYNKGLPGITNNIESTATYLKQIIEQQDVEKVVFLGASSGGYAALLYGYLLEVDEIHAFGAQTKIPNSPEEIKLLEKIESTYFDLATIYQAKATSSNCHLYFDSQFPPDVEHAHRLQQIASVKLHGYCANVGHKITMWLKHQNLLQSIILKALN